MSISKYNPEGYYDPTTYNALMNIERAQKAERLVELQRKPGFRPLVFICSPYANNPINNERRAVRYCKFAIDKGCIPIAPHIYFTRFLDDRYPAERELGMFMGQVLLSKCLEVWVFGEKITRGMEREIAKAEERGLPIKYFSEDMEEA